MERVFITLLIIFILALSYTVINTFIIVRTEYYIGSSKIHHNQKVLFISDTHYGCAQCRRVVMSTIRKLQKEHFDMVILGGDIVQCPVTSKEDMKDIVSELGKFNSRYGIYFVYGNHDAFDDGGVYNKLGHKESYSSDDLLDELTKNSIRVLCDSSDVLVNGILIIGRAYKFNDDTYRRSVSDMITDISKYTICIDHAPICIDECSLAGVDLQLAGHTHGGQIFPINLFQPYVYSMPVYGLRKHGSMSLIVSSGMGVEGFPVRNTHHCEYVVINIIPE